MTTIVDINALINKEQFQTVQKPSLPAKNKLISLLNRLLSPSLNQLFVSNFNTPVNPEKLTFILAISPEKIELVETKNNKKYHFIFQVNKNFLTINKRKSSSKGIHQFATQLKRISLFLLKGSPICFGQFKTPSETSSPNNDCITWASSHITVPPSLHTFPKTHNLKPQAQYLLALSKSLEQPATTPSTNPLQQHFRKLCQKLHAFLNDHSHLMASNALLKKLSTNTIYSLLVTIKKAIYVEKSTVSKNKVTVAMDASTVQLNGAPITKSMLDWFVKKISQIGHDIQQNRTQLYFK